MSTIRRTLSIAAAPPGASDDLEAWQFPDIPPEVYWSLPEANRAGLEQIIRDI